MVPRQRAVGRLHDEERSSLVGLDGGVQDGQEVRSLDQGEGKVDRNQRRNYN